MKKEKGIDDIFKHGLQDPVNEPGFSERDWDVLENMLDEKNGTVAKVAWLRYISVAAAVVIIAFCWWMFKPAATNTPPEVAKTKSGNQVPVIDSVSDEQKQIAGLPQKNEGEVNKSGTAENSAEMKLAGKKEPTLAINNSVVKGTINERVLLPDDKATDLGLIAQPGIKDINAGDFIIASQPPRALINPVDARNIDLKDIDVALKSSFRPLAASKVPVIKKAGVSSLRPQFALTVLASPELNGIGSLRSASRGNNVGLLLTVGVKKFTLTTGASYTVKPYSLPYSQYPSNYSYGNAPQTVTADCRMLDIPINLGYQVFNRAGNKITLGTGVSSYVMTHETYTYDYAAGAKVYGPSFYAAAGGSKYLFSIMNLQATYERKINSKFGLSIQPYYKVPLSEIGYSRVKVQTFGVALGINWNINSLTKPK
jgi:hypothetical protein